MPKPIIPCLIALVLPAFAAAQNSQTTCYMLGNQLHCQTYGQPQVNPGPTFDPSAISRIPAMTDPTRGIEEAYAIRQQQLQTQLLEQQLQAQQEQQREIEAERAQLAQQQAAADPTPEEQLLRAENTFIDAVNSCHDEPCMQQLVRDNPQVAASFPNDCNALGVVVAGLVGDKEPMLCKALADNSSHVSKDKAENTIETVSH